MARRPKLLRRSSLRLAGRVRNVEVFQFQSVRVNQTVYSGTFRGSAPFNNGQVIVEQRPASGSTATPVVRYTIVNASTLRPVTNSVTVRGTQARPPVNLPFYGLPAGSYRLRMTNVGTGSVRLEGAVVVF